MSDAPGLHVLVTGAAGFVGQALARRLASDPAALGVPVARLVLADQTAPASFGAASERISGDLADPAFVRRLAELRCDVVFHLASVPGGLAERAQPLGRRVNLDATLDLIDAIGGLGSHGGALPVVVFASSIAVYGGGLGQAVTAATPLHPQITYGAHKLMVEIALADASRRGLVDGRSLRLPGVVARPRGPAGQASAFMSELLHALAAGERMRCPVSAGATAWWTSAQCAVDNLLHGARLVPGPEDAARCWQLPVLHLSIAQIVQALAERFGVDRPALIDYLPDPDIEAVFGCFPPLDDRAARAVGFEDDGSVHDLIGRALGII